MAAVNNKMSVIITFAGHSTNFKTILICVTVRISKGLVLARVFAAHARVLQVIIKLYDILNLKLYKFSPFYIT